MFCFPSYVADRRFAHAAAAALDEMIESLNPLLLLLLLLFALAQIQSKAFLDVS